MFETYKFDCHLVILDDVLRDEHFPEPPALCEELKLVFLFQYDSLVLRVFPEKLLCDGRML